MKCVSRFIQSMLFAGLLLLVPSTATASPACCNVTAIDSHSGVVTAKDNASGRTFTFQVTNASQLSSLRVGAPIFANFQTKQISLDGRSACCVMVSGASSAIVHSQIENAGTAAAMQRPGMSPGCKKEWLSDHPELAGRICIGSDPNKPAILLVHGLHARGSWKTPSVVGYNYDFRHTPKDADLGHHSGPNAGIYKVGRSDKIDVDPLNWFDYLVAQGFTVATWDQPMAPDTFSPAYESAKVALAQFVADTAAMRRSAPPPIALVGHSRGGLIIHKLLREQGNVSGRIRWVITIHTPHQGSQMAKTPERLAEDAAELFAKVQLPPDVKHPLKEIALQLVSPLKSMVDEGQHELAPESALITGLLNGDAKVDGVDYYTFGGTTPTITRLYTWLFTPMSSVPQYKVKGVTPEQYFVWQVKAAEVGEVSPLLDRVSEFAPEIKAGKGDSLVTDASARLSYAIHQTDSLNHAEVLWNRDLQNRVIQLLSNTRSRAAMQPTTR
jgi:pimeloyl-ACP methyl ester carboxylesterase